MRFFLRCFRLSINTGSMPTKKRQAVWCDLTLVKRYCCGNRSNTVKENSSFLLFYRLCVLNVPPSNSNWGFPDGSIFHHFSPYMITEICKIRFFVTFCVINLPWYTHSSLPRYRVFQFCLDIHSLNENDIKKWWSMYLFRPVPKKFSGRVNPFEFEGGDIKYTKTVNFEKIIFD